MKERGSERAQDATPITPGSHGGALFGKLMDFAAAEAPPKKASEEPPKKRRRVRGEAGVHQSTEMDALGLGKGPELAKKIDEKEPDEGTAPAAALEIYAGNWMRDFSQFKVPGFLAILADISKQPLNDPTGGSAGKIGAAGAERLIDAVLNAIAIVELGPRVAATLVQPSNVHWYLPEHHIDNPIGTSSSDILVREGVSPLRAAKRPPEPDALRDQQLKSSAFPGIQVDSPALYGVSSSGLANHIYNSIEWSKNELILAANASDPAIARMHLGAALHVIEDYYSHSNYIEIALNKFLEKKEKIALIPPSVLKSLSALTVPLQKRSDGTYVDTLYDRKVSDRQAVTTGTFGSTDTKVSIAHVLLPRLVKVRDALMKAVDRIFKLVPRAESSWDRLKASLHKDRPALALAVVLEATDAAGITVSLPDKFEIVVKDNIPSVQLVFRQMSIRQALTSIDNFRKALRTALEAAKTINPLLFVVDTIFDLVDKVMKIVEEKILYEIKSLINRAIFGLLGKLTGLDGHELEKKQLEEAIKLANREVEKLEAATSIEVRLKSGDLKDMAKADLELLIGPVVGRKGSWKAKDPLPPSHSEISKDHPPHAAHGHGSKPAGGGAHQHEDGSIFFALHRALAVSADEAILAQMQVVWGSRIPMLGNGKPYPLSKFDVAQSTCDSLAQSAAKLAKEEGRRFAQTDPVNAALVKNKELLKLLNLVDVLISHPADVTLPAMNRYFRFPHELKKQVEARNATRGART